MDLRRLLLPFLAIATGSSLATSVLAQSCNPISSVPFTISAPGKYCLTQNVRYEGASQAIGIVSDDVVLDFAGYTLTGGVAAQANEFSRGVLAVFRENVTIRNGAIRNFGIGIQTTQQSTNASRGILVEQMLVDGIRTLGITIQGRNAIVQNNRITSVTQTSTTQSGIGILVFASGARILNNSIALVTSPFLPVGIQVAAPGVIVQGNLITDMGVSSNGVSGYGIHVQGFNSSGAIVEKNKVSQSGAASGIAINVSGTGALVNDNVVSGYRDGIIMGGGPSIKYRNNLVSVASIAYSGGTDVGGNN